jgi:hypothetical protein
MDGAATAMAPAKQVYKINAGLPAIARFFIASDFSSSFPA